MSSKKYIMTLDAGSGSGRAVIFDSDGNEISFSQREWLPISLPEFPGAYSFDTKNAWESLELCIQDAMKKGNVDCRRCNWRIRNQSTRRLRSL